LPEYIWFYLTVVFGVIAVASIILLLMEIERRKKIPVESKKEPRESNLAEIALPWTISKTVPDEAVKEAKDKLRVLDLEREILSYAIRRLYEAQAEGKITVEERDSLALKYKEDLERIKQEIARGESIIALSELERMQEEFIRMFSERFEALNKRIEELRAIAGLSPPKPIIKPKEEKEEVTEETPTAHPKRAPTKRRRETTKSRAAVQQKTAEIRVDEKSEADKRIERIMAEIEKALNRLSQIEIEE